MAITEFSGYSPACLEDINWRLAQIDATPNEKIGQHFLINQGAIDLLAQTVTPGSTVIEVGSGTGHVTERLAENASRLYCIEIDRRYRPLLDKVTSVRCNVSIIYGDALRVDYTRLLPEDEAEEGQVVASLPYHIIEPFAQMVAPLRLSSLTLVVGRRYADSLTASHDTGPFGRLSILTSTFYDVDTLATVKKDGFFPVPRTDSSIVQLRPKDAEELAADRRAVVFRHMFLTTRRNSTVRKGLKEGLDVFEQSRDGAGLSKRERNRKSRFNTRLRIREIIENGEADFADRDNEGAVNRVSAMSKDAINRLGLPSSLLDKPFSLLSNVELGMLYESLE